MTILVRGVTRKNKKMMMMNTHYGLMTYYSRSDDGIMDVREKLLCAQRRGKEIE
jgi:hypothetical protein